MKLFWSRLSFQLPTGPSFASKIILSHHAVSSLREHTKYIKTPRETKETAVVYEVRVAGLSTESWAEWFPGIGVKTGTGRSGSVFTLLLVPGPDVSRLHGVLAQIGALNLCLLSVERIERRTE